MLTPILKPLCFTTAWLFILSILWSFWKIAQSTTLQAIQMHKIPCANCQFFTGDYHLKCTIHPTIALTESAIDCPDYQPAHDPQIPKGA